MRTSTEVATLEPDDAGEAMAENDPVLALKLASLHLEGWFLKVLDD